MIVALFAAALALVQPTEPEVAYDEATIDVPAIELDDDGSAAAEAAAAAAADAADAARDVMREVRKIYWEGAGWEVLERTHDCILSNFEVSVAHDSRLNRTEISFGDASIKSLRKGEVRPIRLAWMTGDDGTYGELVRMTAEPVPEDNPSVTIMRGRVSLPGFLDQFAREATIGFMTEQGVVINAWSLDGSAAGVAQLRKCATEVSLARPSDPFAR